MKMDGQKYLFGGGNKFQYTISEQKVHTLNNMFPERKVSFNLICIDDYTL